MNLSEIEKNSEEISHFLEIDIQNFTAEEINNNIFINGLTAIPVYGMENSIIADSDMEIKDESNNLLAIFCLTKSSQKEMKISELTNEAYIAFLIEATEDQFKNQIEHSFNYDYVVVHKSNHTKYESDYSSGSMIWGGYTHTKPINLYARKISKISAKSGIKIPTSTNNSHLLKATLANNNFQRYLSLYHQIELLFDMIFVKKIKQLNIQLDGVGALVKDYVSSRTELDTLKSILKEYFNDYAALESFINKINLQKYKPIMINIFQDHTKTGNVLSPHDKQDKWDELLLLISTASTSSTNLYKSKIIQKDLPEYYHKFMIDLISYWIYRIRCCIAHQKLGEFIFDDSNEDFINEFAIDLIKLVLGNIFSNAKLINLMR